MKKLSFVTVINVFLLFISNGIQSQNVASNLDQLKLMQQFVGTWQIDIGKDTAVVAEFQQYGKVFVETNYRLIKVNKSFTNLWSYSFSAKEGKFKIFALTQSGNYQTWIGSFITENKWIQEHVQNCSPEIVVGKNEIVFENPDQWTMTTFNKDGAKLSEVKLYKVK